MYIWFLIHHVILINSYSIMNYPLSPSSTSAVNVSSFTPQSSINPGIHWIRNQWRHICECRSMAWPSNPARSTLVSTTPIVGIKKADTSLSTLGQSANKSIHGRPIGLLHVCKLRTSVYTHSAGVERRTLHQRLQSYIAVSLPALSSPVRRQPSH